MAIVCAMICSWTLFMLCSMLAGKLLSPIFVYRTLIGRGPVRYPSS